MQSFKRTYFISLLLNYFSLCCLPTIILINGPSGAGKTTLAKNLKNLFLNDYEILSYDKERAKCFVNYVQELELVSNDYNFQSFPLFFDDVKKSWEKLDLETRKKKQKLCQIYFKKFDENFYKNIYDSSLSGKKLIVDTIILGEEQKNYFKNLSGKIFSIFVHSPLATIVERITKTSINEKSEDFRYLNRLLFYYPNYYTVEKSNILDDSISLKIIKEIILKITQNELLSDSFPKGLNLYEHFIKELKINNFEENERLTFRCFLKHDCVIDISKFSSEKAAEHILNKLN